MKAILIFCFIGFSSLLMSQESSPDRYQFLKGDSQLSLGIGLINASDYSFNILGGTGAGSPSPSLNLAYDYAINDVIAIGAFANYYRVDAETELRISEVEDFLDELINDPACTLDCILGLGLTNCICTTTIKERVNVFSIGGKLSLKKSFTPELDTYVSTYLGYSFNRRKTITESVLDGVFSELDSELTVPTIIYFGVLGARYYLSPQVAVYGELGYSNVHLLQLGASYRFK